MTEQLIHRGPDRNGYFIGEQIALGHTRLSIMDLSDGSAQPFSDPSGRYKMLFNGEIYNYKDLKQQLTDYPFITNGDTEVLMAAFVTWGMNCLEKLNGIFAFVIWDDFEGTLWMGRDRLGVKPFYFIQSGELFVFASEIRSILASGFITPKLNRQSLGGFLQFQSAGYPGMLIEGINELPPGHYASFRKGTLKVTSYWMLSNINLDYNQCESNISLNEQLFCLLNDAVSSRMVAAVPTGVFLSGGVDSSGITALMALNSSRAIETFTLSIEQHDLDESEMAEQFSKLYQTNHHPVAIHASDCLSQVSNFLLSIDSPSLDGLNTYLISTAAAKAGMKVVLSGLGGDELFAGYPGFRYAKQLDQFKCIYNKSSWLRRRLTALISGYESSWSRVLYKILSAPSHQISDCYPVFRQLMNTEEVSKLIGTTGMPCVDIAKKLKVLDNSDSTHQLGRYSIAEFSFYAANTLLRDNDQAGMANSLEIREPFFDHRLIEFVINLPDKVKMSKYPKQLLVDALQPLLPPEINRRKKKGFVLPMDRWMRNELKDICDKSIHSLAERDVVHNKQLLNEWGSFQKGNNGVRWTTMWMFVQLGAWMDKNNVI